MAQFKKRRVVTGEELKKKFMQGVDIIEEVAKIGFGKESGLVAIEQDVGNAILSRDGVKNAMKLNEVDHAVQTAISIIRDASEATNALVGDGTTGTILLAAQLYKRGYCWTPLEVDYIKKAIVAEKLVDGSRVGRKHKLSVATTACQIPEMAELVVNADGCKEVVVVRNYDGKWNGVRYTGIYITQKTGVTAAKGKVPVIPLAGVWGDVSELTNVFNDLIQNNVTSGIVIADAPDITATLDQMRAKGLADFTLLPLESSTIKKAFGNEQLLANGTQTEKVIHREIVATGNGICIVGAGADSVAIIELPAATDGEFDELKLRFDDCWLAVRATEMGVVAGGGIPFRNIASYEDCADSMEPLAAIHALLGSPSESKLIVDGEYVVMDTVKGLQAVVENANTAARNLLQTKAAICYIDNKEDEKE